MKKLIFLFSLSVILLACGRKVVNENELLEFVKKEENGLMYAIPYDDFMVTVAVRPNDLIVKQQMITSGRRELDSLREAYGKYLYFVLQIEKDSKDLETGFALDPQTFAERISYLSTSFSEKIQLLTASERVSLKDYLYVRSYGNGPSSFLLVFPKPSEGNFDLVIEGYDLGFGKIQIPFDQDNLNTIPLLNL